MIAVQYSELVAAAQEAHTLDILATHIVHALSTYPLPVPLANTGLKLSVPGQPHQLAVRAHGKTIKSTFDHVWLADDSLRVPKLGGRLRFFDESGEGDVQALYEIVFDTLGNARLGPSKFFGHNIGRDAPDLQETLRRIALGVINAIHDNMETIDGNPDV